MARPEKVMLIGGASSAGKSTLAAYLAGRLGWALNSTDRLARHPGRPWATRPHAVAPHVREHYGGLSDDELIASVLAHRRDMWPLIEGLVREHAEDSEKPPLVLEGSALLPANVASMRIPGVGAIWLTGDERLFEARIHAESRYDEADPGGKVLIDKFVERTRRFNRLVMQDVARLGLPYIAVDEGMTVERLAELCLSEMRPPPSVG